ncbi:hypothetical protein CHE29_14130 [Salmonella enterica]|nr:hypothetical protein CHE29_14130 [Salmonella enterica]
MQFIRKEKKNYFRLESFIKFGPPPLVEVLISTNILIFLFEQIRMRFRQIDAVFFKKFGLHIEKNSHQLQMNEDEWQMELSASSHIMTND